MTLEEINAKLDSLLKEIETWKQPNIKEKGKANV